MIGRYLNQPVTVYPAVTSTDEYHNEVVAVGAGVPTRGLLQQASTTEYTTDRDTTVTQWVLFLPAGTPIGPQSQVTYDGQTFQVDGQPERVWNPRTATVSHIEAKLREVT